MKKNSARNLFFAIAFGAMACAAQNLPAKWEELTGPDFVKAIRQASGVCLLPFGSIEKSGPASPTGTNLFVIRIVAMEAVKQEYAVVFPEYYAGGVIDVSNHPGTIAYSSRLQRELLEETISEMARNGCQKIVILNGHSGNNSLIQTILNDQLLTPKNYVVYAVQGGPPKISPQQPESLKLPAEMHPSKPDADGHGGEERASVLLAYRPDVVHPERGHDEPIVVEGTSKLNLPAGVQTGVSRAKVAPTGYLGDASGATAARGKALVEYTVKRVVEAVRAIKADRETPELQKKFFEQRANPAQ